MGSHVAQVGLELATTLDFWFSCFHLESVLGLQVCATVSGLRGAGIQTQASFLLLFLPIRLCYFSLLC